MTEQNLQERERALRERETEFHEKEYYNRSSKLKLNPTNSLELLSIAITTINLLIQSAKSSNNHVLLENALDCLESLQENFEEERDEYC